MKKILGTGLLSLSLLLTGCTAKKNEQANDKEMSNIKETTVISTEESTGEAEKKNENDEAEMQNSKKEGKIGLTLEEAVAKYQSAFPDSDITAIELEENRGHYYYEIQGMDDDMEYEIHIHAATGEISKQEKELLDEDERHGVERREKALDLTDVLSIEKAGELAEAAVGEGNAVEWSLERGDGITCWEVKVKAGHAESSVTLDSKTGKVLEIDFDD